MKYIIIFLTFYTIFACSGADHSYRQFYKEYDSNFSKETKWLKAHSKNGDLYIFRKWEVGKDTIKGTGEQYDYLRRKKHTGAVVLSIDDVALFETNGEMVLNRENEKLSGLLVQTMLNLELSFLCFSMPKMCFGSCPTFYLDPDKNVHSAVAEGFSSSILPRMESYDIDALPARVEEGQLFVLTMKNEAYETHVVNHLELLLAPVLLGQHAYHSVENKFYATGEPIAPECAIVQNGDDVLPYLEKMDKIPLTTTTHPQDLAFKEDIILTFNNENLNAAKGLVLNFRQSLVTTFLFYSAMDFMGNRVVDILSDVERGNLPIDGLKQIEDHIGGIEVYVKKSNGSDWSYMGEFAETGPIAYNLQLLPIDVMDKQKIEVKLRMSKGAWQIDYAGMVDIIEEITPIAITPECIKCNYGACHDVLHKVLGNDECRLVSLPGDQYDFTFQIPDLVRKSASVFLNVKGYYLEWNREQWLEHKQLENLYQMVNIHPGIWSLLAKEYKMIEAHVNEVFWNSAYDKSLREEL